VHPGQQAGDRSRDDAAEQRERQVQQVDLKHN
jgi:hypothetical protein